MLYQEHPVMFEQTEVTEENIDEVIDELLKKYDTDRLEVAFKFIGKGMCAKSYPTTAMTDFYLQLVLLCQGGESGMELVHLPYQGGIQDQPSRFFHARSIINTAMGKVHREQQQKP